MRRLVKPFFQPFWRLARWCARPLVRRCDAHLAHIVRTVLYHEPQSAAAWLNHLNAVRDELVVTIAQTRQPNSAAPGPDPVGLSELSLLLDSMIREIMRLERQVAALNSELHARSGEQRLALTAGDTDEPLSHAA
jgi:hypothetical protein